MSTTNDHDESVLPTYQQATEPPPSYQSLYGEIKDVRQQSNNVAEYLVKVIILLGSTIGCAVFFGILLAIPIAMIVLGAKYKDDCPKEDKIPIYLIVAGVVLIVRNLSNMCSRRSNEDDDDIDNQSPRKRFCYSILDLFMLCWFITGNVWIYHIYEPSYNKDAGDEYCNKTLYLFSFWVMTATYIFAALCCCCVCVIGGCVAYTADDDD